MKPTYEELEARCAALAAEVYDLKHPGTYLPSKCETPALDAFLAEVRARARNELIDELEARFTELSKTSPTPELRSGAAGAAGFVSTFRKGVQL